MFLLKTPPHAHARQECSGRNSSAVRCFSFAPCEHQVAKKALATEAHRNRGDELKSAKVRRGLWGPSSSCIAAAGRMSTRLQPRGRCGVSHATILVRVFFWCVQTIKEDRKKKENDRIKNMPKDKRKAVTDKLKNEWKAKLAAKQEVRDHFFLGSFSNALFEALH